MKLACTITTPLGETLALVEHDLLRGLWFIGQKYEPRETAAWPRAQDHPVLAALSSQLADYFAGRLRDFDLPLAPRGTPFQTAVWDLLRTIPSGRTVTYGTLARRIGEQRDGRAPSAQAVGGAVGHNPISIVIPCHRVVGANGSLTGYAGGLERKAALLELEQRMTGA